MKRNKPLRADPEKTREWQRKSRKPLVSRKPMAKRNPRREAKRRKSYRAVLASGFHKRLRYAAWERAKGFCECGTCRAVRSGIVKYPSQDDRVMAWTEIPVWFENKAGESWQRFRSKDGELHHESYRYFGDENPEELRVVRWMWKSHHRAIEAAHGTRRRYLTGRAPCST